MSATRLVVKDAEVVCPECGSGLIMHAFNVSVYGRFEVDENGQIIAVAHEVDWSGADGYRAVCPDCGFSEENCDVDIR